MKIDKDLLFALGVALLGYGWGWAVGSHNVALTNFFRIFGMVVLILCFAMRRRHGSKADM